MKILKTMLSLLYSLTENETTQIIEDALADDTLSDLYSVMYLKLNEEMSRYV